MEQLSFIESFEAPFDIVVLYIVLIFNLALTLAHFVQELKGFQWRYLGAIAGLKIPDKLGFKFFFVGPLLIICLFGLVGIFRLFDWPPPPLAAFCLGALIGSRISDSIFIHISPSKQGYCPNPALGTIPFYLLEAPILTALFFPGLRSHYICAVLGFGLGWLLFSGVLPLLRFLRKNKHIAPKFLRTIKHIEPWQAGEKIPPWVQGHDNEEARSV